MKKGFTILELLVASMLLGMLMTALTMIFNQSSISWRIGEAAVADLDDASDGISAVRYEADNLYNWGTKSYALLSIWDRDGNLRVQKRALVDESGQLVSDAVQDEKLSKLPFARVREATYPGNWNVYTLDNEKTHGGANTYTVNVMSAGPNRQFDDYDDIWSFPDEFQ